MQTGLFILKIEIDALDRDDDDEMIAQEEQRAGDQYAIAWCHRSSPLISCDEFLVKKKLVSMIFVYI